MLKINSKMQIVDINTEVVYGTLFRGEDGYIYFCRKWYIEYLSKSEKGKIDNILREINNA